MSRMPKMFAVHGVRDGELRVFTDKGEATRFKDDETRARKRRGDWANLPLSIVERATQSKHTKRKAGA